MITEPGGGATLYIAQAYRLLLWAGVLADWYWLVSVLARKAYRVAPILATYVLVSALGDTAGAALYLTGLPRASWFEFLVATALEYGLEIGVALEITAKAPQTPNGNRGYKQRFSTAGLLAGCGAASLLLTGIVTYRHVTAITGGVLRLELADGLFRALVFLCVLGLLRVRRAPPSSWALRTARCLALYFGVALLSQWAHEAQAMRGAQFDHFETIECFRMLAWVIMATTLGFGAPSYRKETARTMARSGPRGGTGAAHALRHATSHEAGGGNR